MPPDDGIPALSPMNARVRRRLFRGLVVLLATIMVVGGWFVAAAMRVGVGYKAKSLCSGVFVSKRDAAALLDEMSTDDLGVMRYLDASVDCAAETATASAFGLMGRRAVYREGLGCTLALDGVDPPRLSRHTDALTRGTLPTDVKRPGDVSSRVEAVVARAFDEPNPMRPRRTFAVIVLQYGRVVAERYAAGITDQTPLTGWSMTKSVINALAGILVKQGRLSVDAPAPVAEWARPGYPRGAITLDHLLRMSSGLRVDESRTSPRADVLRMLFETPDAAAYAASKPLAFAPGARWEYSNGGPNIVSRAIRTAIGDPGAYPRFPARRSSTPSECRAP